MFPTSDLGREAPPGSLADFDSSPHLMCVRDMQGRLVRVNKAWEATLGYAVDEIADAPLLSLIHPEDVFATRLRMEEADKRRGVADFVNRYRRRDGDYRMLKWRAQRVGDVIVGQARDVTSAHLRGSELRANDRALPDWLLHMSERVNAPSIDLLETARMLQQTKLTIAQRTMVRRLEQHVSSIEEVASSLAEVGRSDLAWMVLPASAQSARAVLGARTQVRESGTTERTVNKTPVEHPQTCKDAPYPLGEWISSNLRHEKEHQSLYFCLRDSPSRLLGLLSIYLDQIGDFYPRRLLSLIAESELMSAGRAAALLRRLRDMGFVAVAGEFKAGQVRPYRVLPPMAQAFARQMIINIRIMAASEAQATFALEEIEADEQRAKALLASLAELVLLDLSMNTAKPAGPLNGVLLMASGRAIVLTIGADAIQRNGENLEGRIHISVSAYARRFGVSRAHIRRVLRKLEDCGLNRDAASSSAFVVSSHYRDELESLAASEWSLLSDALARTARLT